MRLIKRYSNRKLYDTVAKKYITLENIEILIKEGEKLQIFDNDSNEEITANILSLIIAEQTKKQRLFSPSLFVKMIRKGQGSMYDYFSKIVQAIGETAYFIEEEIENKVRHLISTGEITEEEGAALSKDLQGKPKKMQMEEYLESLVATILKKLNIPEQSDVERLSNCIEKLEQRIEHLQQNANLSGDAEPVDTSDGQNSQSE